MSAIAGLSVGSQGQVVNLFDMSDVYRGRQTDPEVVIRFNGSEAFTLGIAGLSTENIVEVGKRADAKFAELDTQIPFGVEILPIYQQHVVVEQASNDFLAEPGYVSDSIVVAVLGIFMGWRAAVVVGSTLSADRRGHALVHVAFLDRDGADFTGRPDHRDGNVGGQRHRGRRGDANRHAAR